MNNHVECVWCKLLKDIPIYPNSRGFLSEVRAQLPAALLFPAPRAELRIRAELLRDSVYTFSQSVRRPHWKLSSDGLAVALQEASTF